ncbi:MAG: hypothetical protein IJL87_06035 [Clostridia bacterium]|nr:hypothetical protein [Clostridia bacterium]
MRQIKRIIIFACALCIIINLCSCAGYTKLSQRLIVQMLFIEKTEEGWGIAAFEQKVDEKSKKRVYAKGENPILAVEQIGLVSGKRPLLSHVRLVAFSDNISEKELLNCLEIMSKDNQVPPEAQILYLKGCKGEQLANDDK